MIKTIVKRDGRKEEFSPNKLNGWGEWAAKSLGSYVDWSSVVLETVSTLPAECSSELLQERLIKTCLDRDSWSYNRMAGRLYAALINKILYEDNIPTVKELHQKLAAKGFMVVLDYNDEEYAKIEKIINHKLDFKSTHFELHQIRSKYAIKNRTTGEEFESQQFVYMRMAMALAEDQPKDRRLEDVKMWYDHFSQKRLNAPTPNFVNLGTSLRGYASCCVFTTEDTAKSIEAGVHIGYTMTTMSAGIGAHMNVRSLGDPVRGGVIQHQGKLPYYRYLVAAVHSSLQNGRGGAATMHYSAFDPEVNVISQLKNPMSTEDKKIRGMDYSFGSNKFFARKAAKNEEVFLFNVQNAPDLVEAMYSKDETEFEKLYNKYEKNKKFKKTYISARELLITVLNEGYETGRAYLHFPDEMNKHTPFKDTIYSSNLCVASDTLITTDKGDVRIKDVAGQFVNVWNGEQYSRSYVEKTGEGQNLLLVKTSDGKSLECTPYHKWYILENDKEIEVRTNDLVIGDKISTYYLPDGSIVKSQVIAIVEGSKNVDTYCLNEPLRHKAVFNGILTGQCQEIALPTKGYPSVKELYSTEDHGLGEVGLCSLAGVVVSNIESDEQYEDVMYYALLMIDKCIHMSDYALPHLGVTAKARLSAGIGIIGLAHLMAKNKLLYTSQEGKNFIHELSEKHMYFAIKASLKLGKELGNAPWMYKTKWPEGWLPIDTYNKNVDSVVTVDNKLDWEGLRQEIIDNGGIRNSVLICQMPSESCLDKDQRIKVPGGTISFEEILLSNTNETLDSLYSRYDTFTGGEWINLNTPIVVETRYGNREVDKIWYNGLTNYISLIMEDGSEVKCTHHHKFLVIEENGDKVWKMACLLKEGDDILEV